MSDTKIELPIEITDEEIKAMGESLLRALVLHEHWGEQYLRRSKCFWKRIIDTYGELPSNTSFNHKDNRLEIRGDCKDE